MSPDDHRHGTYAGAAAHRAINQPPCYPCRVAHANYLGDRARQRAYGRWNPWTDAEPARRHVRNLMANGTSIKRIAHAADVMPTRISYLLYGRGGKPAPAKIRPDFANAILNVTDDPGRVPSWRIARRLAALVALGYPQPYLADRLGCSQGRIWGFLRETQTNVTAGTLADVDALYEELSMRLPVANTKLEKYRVSRAKDTARRNGYAPPLAWSDIDDPDEQPKGTAKEATGIDPVVVERLLAGDQSIAAAATRAERTEVVRRWAQDGRSLAELERLTGWRPDRYFRKGDAA